MNVKITMAGPGGELDSTTLENIDDETDDRISAAVAVIANSAVWAVGDTLTISSTDEG